MAAVDGETLSYAREGPEPRAPFRDAPQLVLLFECDRPTAASARWSLEGTSLVRLGRGAARGDEREKKELRVRVADRWMSQEHAELRREGEGFVLVDSGSKNGSFANGERRARHALTDGDVLLL